MDLDTRTAPILPSPGRPVLAAVAIFGRWGDDDIDRVAEVMKREIPSEKTI
jgi:hypothetical protein